MNLNYGRRADKSSALFFLFHFYTVMALAQLPIVSSPVIPSPTEAIYLDPNGNDLNLGTSASPKKTFAAALSALSFGQVGVQGGHSYVEVVYKSGDYYPTGSNSYVQNLSDWRKQIGGVYVYKNVSIRGIGTVVLHGDSLNAGSQMIYLTGSGISVRNIKVKNSKLHGVAVVGSNISHHSNLIIDSVHVDGAVDNGIWVTGYDRLIVRNSSTINTCTRNYKGIGSCNWASALRVENSRDALIEHNKVFFNWGEGINTSYVRNVKVQDNEAHDNYSINIYCHSSSNAVYAYNLVYNVDSTYWRYCHNLGGVAGTGISCANELSCTNACFGYTNSCGSLNSCCAELDYDHLLYQSVPYVQTDSVFIFNNVVLNAGISIWDNFSGYNNYANISNYFISHNTVIGVAGNPAILKPLINISMGTPFVRYSNVNFQNNIFSTDTNNAKIVSLNTYVPSGICSSTWQSETRFSSNLWNKNPTNAGLNFSQEFQNSILSQNVSFNDLTTIIPSSSNSSFVQTSSPLSYIQDDYYHNSRKSATNLGAIEQGSVGSNLMRENEPLLIYPIPAIHQVYFNKNLVNTSLFIRDLQGKNWLELEGFSGNVLDVSNLPPGIYFLKIQNLKMTEQFRLMIQ